MSDEPEGEPYLEPFIRSWLGIDALMQVLGPFGAASLPHVAKRERVAGIVRTTYSDGTAWWYVIRDGIGRYEQDTSRGWDALG